MIGPRSSNVACRTRTLTGLFSGGAIAHRPGPAAPRYLVVLDKPIPNEHHRPERTDPVFRLFRTLTERDFAGVWRNGGRCHLARERHHDLDVEYDATGCNPLTCERCAQADRAERACYIEGSPDGRLSVERSFDPRDEG